MKMVFKMLVGFAKYFLVTYIILIIIGYISFNYFDTTIYGLGLKPCWFFGFIGAWRGRVKELNKREHLSMDQEG